ncbi:Odorant receptor 36 [Cephus cinctus]|uniref:Odorant receptor n=1 Tax=Cephus cinctus TaxID=211228 RepID=A0A1W6L1C6_CEPCN|nr:odorant receptor 27 [Cephus cinctus]RLZ02240.1 Odorant receptor 36 [Cephus cinctus]
MTSKESEYRSVKFMRILMKIVGMYYTENPRERLLLRVALTYAIIAILFALAVEFVDLYHCLGDFSAVMYNLCSTMPLVMVLVKISNFLFHWNVMMYLISFAQNNFWCDPDDDFTRETMKRCDKYGKIFVYLFTNLVLFAVLDYIFAPVVENFHRNETDRILPFTLWVNLPVTVTPYYEITYTIQSLSTLYTGICTCFFDNFISVLNIYVAGQLEILGHRVETVADTCIDITMKDYVSEKSKLGLSLTLKKFKSCINQHQILISYIEQMERAFTLILLGQLILSSFVICVGGFQLMATMSFLRKFTFICHFMAGLTQLLLYTWSCNQISEKSLYISQAAYNTRWYLLPYDETGKSLRNGILFLMLRAQRPCQLTAGKFSPITLQTLTAILSTAMSYFTMLRQMSEDDV